MGQLAYANRVSNSTKNLILQLLTEFLHIVQFFKIVIVK